MKFHAQYTRCLNMADVEVSLAIASSRCVPINIRILTQDARGTGQTYFMIAKSCSRTIGQTLH
jgi:hypothetical protein